MDKTRLSRGLAATIVVIGSAIVVIVLALLLLVPLVGAVRDFLHHLPATVQQLQDSDELSSIGDSGAAGNVQEGAQRLSEHVPEAISAVLGVAGSFFSLFLAAFTILFVCLFLLSDIETSSARSRACSCLATTNAGSASPQHEPRTHDQQPPAGGLRLLRRFAHDLDERPAGALVAQLALESRPVEEPERWRPARARAARRTGLRERSAVAQTP